MYLWSGGSVMVHDVGYPLKWPPGHPRVDKWRRRDASFRASLAQARDSLLNELRILQARNVQIYSNVAGLQPKQPDDPGVAVEFDLQDEQGEFIRHVLPCDKWRRVEHNLRALAKTIEAIRLIERWGTGGVMLRAFSGFRALPPGPTAPPPIDWWLVLDVPRDCTLEEARTAFRALARSVHPDMSNGSHAAMADLNRAMEAAEAALAR